MNKRISKLRPVKAGRKFSGAPRRRACLEAGSQGTFRSVHAAERELRIYSAELRHLATCSTLDAQHLHCSSHHLRRARDLEGCHANSARRGRSLYAARDRDPGGLSRHENGRCHSSVSDPAPLPGAPASVDLGVPQHWTAPSMPLLKHNKLVFAQHNKLAYVKHNMLVYIRRHKLANVRKA